MTLGGSAFSYKNMTKRLYLSLILVTISAFALGTEAQTRPRKTSAKKPVAAKPKPPALSAGAVKTESGLTYLVTQKGTGRMPKDGETVIVHYTGMFTSGVKFDSSHDRGQPISFPLGQGRVIKGWDEGIGKLRIGDQAIFVIPSAIAYGTKGKGSIPPDTTLVFIVELVEIKE